MPFLFFSSLAFSLARLTFSRSLLNSVLHLRSTFESASLSIPYSISNFTVLSSTSLPSLYLSTTFPSCPMAYASLITFGLLHVIPNSEPLTGIFFPFPPVRINSPSATSLTFFSTASLASSTVIPDASMSPIFTPFAIVLPAADTCPTGTAARVSTERASPQKNLFIILPLPTFLLS